MTRFFLGFMEGRGYSVSEKCCRFHGDPVAATGEVMGVAREFMEDTLYRAGAPP